MSVIKFNPVSEESLQLYPSDTEFVKTETDPLSVHLTGGTMTGGLTIAPSTDVTTALVVNDKDSNNVLIVRTTDNTVTASLLTMLGGITLATGSTTVFPIKFVAGPLLTVPVAGVMEFDGTDLYITV